MNSTYTRPGEPSCVGQPRLVIANIYKLANGWAIYHGHCNSLEAKALSLL
jgi:hypothetical protein